MKKVEGLEKQHEKQKVVADKRLLKENQALQDELKKLKYHNEQLFVSKDAELEKLVADRTKFKKKAIDLMAELERIKLEYNTSEAKLKEEVKELSKRCQQVTEKLQSQKQDFHSTVQKLNMTYEEEKMELQVQISSFTGQKKAYLERIGQLESDLEILERSIFQKDEQIERLQRQVLKSKSMNESEFESTKKSLETALEEIESLKATSVKNQVEFEEELEKMRELLDHVHSEKDQEQQRFEAAIMALEQTIAQYESEYAQQLKERDDRLLEADAEIQRLSAELDSSNQKLNLTQMQLSRKEADLEKHRSESTETLNEMRERLSSADVRVKDLELVLEQTKTAEILSNQEHVSELANSRDRIRHLEELLYQQKCEFEAQMRAMREESNRLSLETDEIAQRALDAQECHSQEISRYTQELDAMKHKAEEAGAALREFEVQTSKAVLEFESRIDSLNMMVEDLREALEESEDARKRLELDASGTKHMLESELTATKDEFLSTKTKLDEEISDLQVKLKQAMSQSELISLKFQEAQGTIRLLEEHNGKEQSLASIKLQKAYADLKDRDISIEKLQEDLLASQKTVQMERKSKDTSELTHAMIQKDLKRNVEEYKKRMDQLVADHEILMKANSDVVKKAVHTETIALEILREKQDYFDQLLGFCAALDIAKNDLADTELSLEKLTSHYEDICETLDDQVFISDISSRMLADAEKENSIHLIHQFDIFQVVQTLIEEQMSMQLKLDDWMAETGKLRNLVCSLKDENSKIRSFYQECQIEVLTRRQSEENLEKHVQSLQKKLMVYREQIEYLNFAMDVYWESEQQIKHEKNSLISTIATLESKLTDLKVLYSESESSRESLTRAIHKDEIQLENNRKCLEELHDAAKQKQMNIDSLEEEIRQYQLTVDQLRAKIAQLDGALTEASGREIEQNELFHQTRSMMESRIEKMGEELRVAQGEITRLSEQLKHASESSAASEEVKAALLTQIEELRVQNSSLNKDVEKLNMTLVESKGALRKSQEEQSRTQSQLLVQQERLDEVERALNHTQACLATYSQENAHLREAIVTKEKDFYSLQKSFESASTLKEHLSEQMDDLIATKEQMRIQIQQLQYSKDEMTENFKRERSDLKNLLDEANAKLVAEKECSEKLKEMVNLTKLQISQEQEESTLKLERFQSEMQAQIIDLRFENEKLESELQFLKERNEELQTKNEVDSSRMNHEISELQSELTKISSLLEQKGNDLRIVQSELADSRQHVKSLELERDDLNSTIEHLNVGNKSEQDSLKLQLKELKVYSDRLQSALDIKRQELNETLKENHRLVEEVKMIRMNSKSEFGSMKQQISELQNYSKEEHDRYEAMMKDLKQLLSSKTSQCQILQNKLEDALSTISRSELRMANETSSRDLAIRNLKMELREKTKALESLESSLIITNQEKSLIHDQLENSVAVEVEKQIQLAAQGWENERSTLLQKIEEYENQELERMKEMDR
jgi:chromosome segregation ATPase